MQESFVLFDQRGLYEGARHCFMGGIDNCHELPGILFMEAAVQIVEETPIRAVCEPNFVYTWFLLPQYPIYCIEAMR